MIQQRDGKCTPPRRRKARRRLRRLGPTLLTAGVILAMGCGDDPAAPRDTPTFRVEVSGERFTVQVANPAQLPLFEARLRAGAEGVILGTLLPGDGGFNQPWTWHMDPATTQVADLAIEVCDGRPSMVESDLDYWLYTLGQFCPWGARVVERIR